jgi:hypothetical protein
MATAMQAGQYYLPVDVYQDLKNLAKRKGISLAALIREASVEKLERSRIQKTSIKNLPAFAFEPLGNPKDGALQIDKYLY